jgi:hypothetical protein
MATTKIADVIVPEVFTPYTQQLTQEKSALIQAGVLTRDPSMDSNLAGGGLTFNAPSFNDLDNEDENVSTDNDGSNSTPSKIQTSLEVAVRLSRNKSWSSMDLASALAGADPMQAIASRVSEYWARRLQAAYVATMQGVFADNAAAPTGADKHAQNDMTLNVAGSAFSAGVTNFTAEAFLDAAVTMGDSMEQLTAIMVHSIVYNRMQKNNLIDFIPDATGQVNIPTFLGRRVIVDDGLPNPAGRGAAQTSSGVFHSWILGSNVARFGLGQAKVPTEVERKAAAGDGGGQDILHNRVEWALHPVGHAFVGTAAAGGPNNTATAGNLAHADSWRRVYGERKMIRVARLITRES